MIIVALEDIYINTILTFCENLAELGMPKDEDSCDLWFRYLSKDKQIKVAEKMIEIEERYAKEYDTKKDKKSRKRK